MIRELWNRPAVRRRTIFGVILVVVVGFFWMSSGSTDAIAAPTAPAPPPLIERQTFTVVAQPVDAPMSRTGEAMAVRCWFWDFGPLPGWESRDNVHRLRYGYGEKADFCTNLAATKWVDQRVFQPRHWTGYYHETSTRKWKSPQDMQTLWLLLHTNWEFEWSPGFGLPTIHHSVTLECNLKASNHVAYCERWAYGA